MVHPHACGDNKPGLMDDPKTLRFIPTHVGTTYGQIMLRDTDGGSSPRMWGQHAAVRQIRQLQSVHPHACGDNWRRRCRGRIKSRFIPTHVGTTQLVYLLVTVSKGSSPRMWGQLGALVREMKPYRFIPTHVGTTERGRERTAEQSVHPHACGDNPSKSPSIPLKTGSSPRMWGQRRVYSLH